MSPPFDGSPGSLRRARAEESSGTTVLMTLASNRIYMERWLMGLWLPEGVASNYGRGTLERKKVISTYT